MKKQFFSFLLSLLFAFSVSAQTEETLQIDAFGRISCGNFMARMDLIFNVLKNSANSKIYVVYYGGRFRKESLQNAKTKSLDKIELAYPHREDGLNWAKSIPLFLTKARSIKDEIVLVNGGFRENTEVEIWLVPRDAESPKPTPTVAEKDIKFRKDKPSGTPDFTACYSEE